MKRALFGALLLAGCPSKDEHAPAPGVLPDATPMPSISAAPTASGPIKPLPCRAIAVKGKVTDTDGGTSMSLGGQLPDSIFALDEGANMTVKDPASGREVTFEGAATVRTCVGGDPEHWLLTIGGGFSATPSAGEKPGAEEWVITPFGIVRFASAMVKIRVEKQRVTVRVSSGSVSIYGPKLATPDAGAPLAAAEWTDATPTTPLDLLSPGGTKKLVDGCATVAKTARELGAQLVTPDANIGDLAPKHLEARRKARAACALARAASWGDASLFMRAEVADAEWRIVAR
jgi:hypothetical protein